jgi:hypothetical protein
MYSPDSSSFTPIYVSTEALSDAWIKGTMHRYDDKVAWWNFCVVGNYAGRFYKYAMEPVRKLQHRLENELTHDINSFEKSLKPLLSKSTPKDLIKQLTKYTIDKGDYISKEWRDLFPFMLASYRDGYHVSGFNETTIHIKRFFYPRWWLQATGFFDHAPNADGILFNPSPFAIAGNAMANQNFLLICISALVFFIVGMFYGNKQRKPKRSAYGSIDVSSSLDVKQTPWSSMLTSTHKMETVPLTSTSFEGEKVSSYHSENTI